MAGKRAHDLSHGVEVAERRDHRTNGHFHEGAVAERECRRDGIRGGHGVAERDAFMFRLFPPLLEPEPHADDVQRARRSGLEQPLAPRDDRIPRGERALYVGEGRERGVVPIVAGVDLTAGDETQDRPVGERGGVGADVDRSDDAPKLYLALRPRRLLFDPRRTVADTQLDLLTQQLEPGVGRRGRVGEHVRTRHVHLDAGPVGLVVEPHHGSGEARVAWGLWRAGGRPPNLDRRVSPRGERGLHAHGEFPERCRSGVVVVAVALLVLAGELRRRVDDHLEVTDRQGERVFRRRRGDRRHATVEALRSPQLVGLLHDDTTRDERARLEPDPHAGRACAEQRVEVGEGDDARELQGSVGADTALHIAAEQHESADHDRQQTREFQFEHGHPSTWGCSIRLVKTTEPAKR